MFKSFVATILGKITEHFVPLLLLYTALFIIFGVVLWNVLAPKEIDFCSVAEYQAPHQYYELRGQRRYYFDVTIKSAATLEEAVAAAKLINCTLK